LPKVRTIKKWSARRGENVRWVGGAEVGSRREKVACFDGKGEKKVLGQKRNGGTIGRAKAKMKRKKRNLDGPFGKEKKKKTYSGVERGTRNKKISRA